MAPIHLIVNQYLVALLLELGKLICDTLTAHSGGPWSFSACEPKVMVLERIYFFNNSVCLTTLYGSKMSNIDQFRFSGVNVGSWEKLIQHFI